MRHRLTVVIAVVALACGVPTAPPFPGDGPPAAFAVRYGGFGFGSHDVELRGDTLVVTRRFEIRPDSARVTRVVPTREAWRDFWRAADDAGVRSWPRECRNDGVADGDGFALRVDYAGGHVESSGGNAYPRRDGRCSTTPEHTAELRALFAAVTRLIGQPYP